MRKSPEKLEANSGNSAEKMDTSHLEVLTEMSSEFDPVQAKEFAEQERSRNAEKPSPEHSKAVGEAKMKVLATLPEKQEKELSPQDAANEYLSLLDELSQDFSNPQYDGGMPTTWGNQPFVGEIGLKYSDDPHYRKRGYAGTEADATDRTMYRIGMADFILENEIKWRNVTDEQKNAIDKNNEQVEKEVADLDANYSKKGPLGKLFGKKKYAKARIELYKKLKRQPSAEANNSIAQGLAYVYDETGPTTIHDVKFQKVVEDNEALNRRFFGLDDPERAKKVERAIELRQKYEAEWSKKK